MKDSTKTSISRFLHVSGNCGGITGLKLLDDSNRLFSFFMAEYSENKDIIESPLYSFLSDRKILPLWVNSTLIASERKTFSTILRDLINVSIIGELRKVVSKEGNIYYGMKGLILDANFEPLILLTVRHGNVDSTPRTLILRINPKVFNNRTVIDNGIIKYLIPYFSINTTYSTYLENLAGCSTSTTIVDNNIKNFIVYPNIPNSINTNEEIQQLLVDNIDKLCL